MTRITQKQKINLINEKLSNMATLLKEQLEMSMDALEKKDIALAKTAIKKDDEIDSLQKEIEEECIKFIATEQPLAKDLRRVFTASKIVTDLERMADHTVDICKIVRFLENYNRTNDFKELWDMKDKIIHMIDVAMEAYLNRDADKAYEICNLDDEVDEIHKRLFKKLLIEIKEEDEVESATRLLFVSKHLERIGDYVTNVCEWIIFSKKGKYVDLND
ncbi:MAG: phosphate signaling complex protein PhoU [Clostridium sp.]|uniref:phosphate signaling complex protein PhoU n=2 Tax=Clostridium TaxID=1485 RepID=UPI002152C13A|nr:phosphate signaling complex protein PhoU [Clostridium sp. LY3-2]MCR6515888.1 phosphate signaling complex protein PhoU [Clostridium sp. LY3-2]